MQPALPESCAILLAGGESRRMGQDKGLLLFKGMPMILHVARAATQVCPEVLLVSRHAAHGSLGLKVVADEEHGIGPAAGILSGLRHSQREYNLVLSCDIPLIHPDILRLLLARCESHPVVVAQGGGQVHPLIGVYRRSCIPALEEMVAGGERKLRKIISGLGAFVVDLDQEMPGHDPRWLLNLNTPEALAAAEHEST